jgi:Fur family ferric uptake transcriptional regulator
MLAEEWLDQLRDSGCRLTKARKAVVATVANSRRAITPLQIFASASRRYRRLGLVSVYRTLEKLEALGLVMRVHRPEGCEAFIGAGSGHQHLLLCENCGRATFFRGDKLDPLIDSISRRSGYAVHQHWLQLFGLCVECQGRGDAGNAN